jgi:hypothetical protein
VFPVAGRADGSGVDTLGNGTTVHAGAELLRDFCVAHATGVWDCFVESCGTGSRQLVHVAVAHAAVGSRCVAVSQCLPMYASGVFTDYLGVALVAERFGNPGRVGILLVA